MGNVIKRTTIFIEAECLIKSDAFCEKELIGNYKTEMGWIAKDSDGKKWLNLTKHLRNENFYRFISQYSMADIIYYMQRKNADYYTVYWDFLVEAVNTALEESICKSIDDIYNYISENLI